MKGTRFVSPAVFTHAKNEETERDFKKKKGGSKKNHAVEMF